MKTKKSSKKIAPSERQGPDTTSFRIVGIGASAGGLEAFEKFFRQMPVDSGLTFVLAPHLAPDHASLLTEILQRSTTMPVQEARDQVQAAANTVYIIPPNRNMSIFHGKLQLCVPDAPRGQRLPIDAFLTSLAEDQGKNAVGIILSGTGADGALGLRAIVEAGGVTLVQEPTSAKYDGMPSSAIRAGCAMYVLPVEDMPGVLISGPQKRDAVQGVPPAPTAPNATGVARILMHLRMMTGQDFSQYKKSTIMRRIERRMAQHGVEDTEIYARYLKENPAEVHILFKELLINVTSFFRDAEAFTVLQTDIMPLLCKDKQQYDVFRVWVAGCASGEEAYSIAIILREWMDENHCELKAQIYSTDLDADAITTARAGLYPHSIASDVTPERLHRFFVKDEVGYRVKKEIREMVVFAVQNVIKDPPFTKLDLLSCRNLLIYLEPELQNRLIPAFHYALRPGGILFLSPSESIGNHTQLFAPVSRKWKFYRAMHTQVAARAMMASPLTWGAASNSKVSEESMKNTKEANFADLTRRVLLQYFSPASIVADSRGEILYVHGETGKYLRPAPGHASLNVVEMAREGLELELRAAVNAACQGTATLNREIRVKTNGGYTMVRLSVRPLPNQDGQNLLLISFQDIATPSARSKRKSSAQPAEQGRVDELERELAHTKENLQATIEEQQAANEELKATNEELQSTNEELQSTNEELETSKEELQSVNEELITVNGELQAKIEQLASMQNDMKNLLDNTNIGAIFLDEHMIVRRFSREATKVYRLVASDVGRHLADIKSDLEGDELLIEAQSVLETLAPFEHEIASRNGAWYLVRIQPYRTLENVIEGVVLTFTDISQRVKAEGAERHAREVAESIVDTIREPLLVLDANLRVMSANRAFYQCFQVKAADTVGLMVYDLGAHQWDIPALRTLLEEILPRDQVFERYEMEYTSPGAGRRKILLNARRITGKSGELPMILLAMELTA